MSASCRSRSCSSVGPYEGRHGGLVPQEKCCSRGPGRVRRDALRGRRYLADWPATLDAIAALAPDKLVPAAVQPQGSRAGQGGARRHARVRHRDVRVGEGGRGGRQGPAHDLPRHYAALKPASATGDLRPLLRSTSRAPTTSDGSTASAHLDRSATTEMWQASKGDGRTTMKTYTNRSIPTCARATRMPAGASCGRRGRCRADRARVAIDLRSGVPVVVLDEDETVSSVSRAICSRSARWRSSTASASASASSTRASAGTRQVFFRDVLAYRFDLLPESGHRRPAFVNLQQYWLEEFLVDRARELPAIDLR